MRKCLQINETSFATAELGLAREKFTAQDGERDQNNDHRESPAQNLRGE
jgi:hypothetical protein